MALIVQDEIPDKINHTRCYPPWTNPKPISFSLQPNSTFLLLFTSFSRAQDPRANIFLFHCKTIQTLAELNIGRKNYWKGRRQKKMKLLSGLTLNRWLRLTRIGLYQIVSGRVVRCGAVSLVVMLEAGSTSDPTRLDPREKPFVYTSRTFLWNF